MSSSSRQSGPAGSRPRDTTPAHHRSIHPLRRLARTLADGSPAGLALTFLAAPDLDDTEPDQHTVPADPIHLHLDFRAPY